MDEPAVRWRERAGPARRCRAHGCSGAKCRARLQPHPGGEITPMYAFGTINIRSGLVLPLSQATALSSVPAGVIHACFRRDRRFRDVRKGAGRGRSTADREFSKLCGMAAASGDRFELASSAGHIRALYSAARETVPPRQPCRDCQSSVTAARSRPRDAHAAADARSAPNG